MVADYRAYTPGDYLVFCTTPVESICHAAIAEDLRRVIAEIDAVLETRFEQAQVEGDFPGSN